MLDKVRVKVCGKINLSLNITGISNGLHTLSSMVASVDVCDTVTVRDRLDDKVNLICNADYRIDDNIVYKAVEALRKQFGQFGADIVVDKALPLAGGMGGSSADAAGVIVALSRLFDFDKRGLDMKKTCSLIGSDVYYMTRGGYAEIKGTGDRAEFFDIEREMGIVYIYGGELLTGKVYSAFDALGGDEPINNGELLAALKEGKKPQLNNMLTRAAMSLNDNIKRNADALSSIGLDPNMTGSGSVVYAISDDPMGDAARLNAKGYKAVPTRTKSRGIEFV